MNQKHAKHCVSVVLAACCVIPSLASSVRSRSGELRDLARLSKAATTEPDTLEERIKRVENGLLPPYMIGGSAPAPMKLVDRMNHYRIPGISIAVIEGSSIQWARAYGVLRIGTARQVNANSVFQAGAASTALTAMTALSYVQDGTLRLDQNANQKLIDWKIPDSSFTGVQKVTLRRLLEHTSGLNVRSFEGYDNGAAIPTVKEILNGHLPANSPPLAVSFVPGTKSFYSSGSFVVIQQLLTDVSHASFSEQMKTRVLDVLGLTRSSFALQPPDTDAAIGHNAKGEPLAGGWREYPEFAAQGLWTTPTDLARFLIELQKSRVGQSNRVLNQETTQRMLTPGSDKFGLGVTIVGSGSANRINLEGANAGYRTYAVAFMNQGRGAVIMTNSDNSGEFVQELFRSIAKEYQWPAFAIETVQPVQVDPQVYTSFVGTYELLNDVTIVVTTANGKLFWNFSGKEKMELIPTSETVYVPIEYANLRITFNRNQAGAITGLTLKRGDDVMTAKKM